MYRQTSGRACCEGRKGEVEIKLYQFVTSAPHGGRFTPRENAPAAHSVRGWVSFRFSLDSLGKTKPLEPDGF
jgi:hypothetical protein